MVAVAGNSLVFINSSITLVIAVYATYYKYSVFRLFVASEFLSFYFFVIVLETSYIGETDLFNIFN